MKNVAILTGGQSSEREIALLSAASVSEALKGRAKTTTFDLPSELDTFLKDRANFDVAVPVFHGKGGEDGAIQGFLKTLGVPFLFSDVTAHAIGLNKKFTKRIAESVGLQTAKEGSAVFPVIVKPVDGGSSIGVSVAKNETELQDAVKKASEFSEDVLVEQYVVGEEFTVAVIDEDGRSVALPVIKIVPKGSTFFDYKTKYDASLVDELCPAPIDDELAKRLQEAGLTAHAMIGARHISRSDFIVDKEGGIWFLEINTIPGQTLNSLVPKAIRASGREFGEVLEGWIEEAS